MKKLLFPLLMLLASSAHAVINLEGGLAQFMFSQVATAGTTPGTTYYNDTFTTVSNSSPTSHTPDTGSFSWTGSNSSDGNMTVFNGGYLAPANSTADYMIYATTATSATTPQFKLDIWLNNALSTCRVDLRFLYAFQAQNGYRVTLNAASSGLPWEVDRIDAGSTVLLSSAASLGTSLGLAGSQLNVWFSFKAYQKAGNILVYAKRQADTAWTLLCSVADVTYTTGGTAIRMRNTSRSDNFVVLENDQ